MLHGSMKLTVLLLYVNYNKSCNSDKCSHGGKDDITADSPATGGINKDTMDDKFSPHHYLHVQVDLDPLLTNLLSI